MSSEKKEKKQHKMNFNIKEKLKKTFSKEHLKEVFTGEEQKKHLGHGEMRPERESGSFWSVGIYSRVSLPVAQ